MSGLVEHIGGKLVQNDESRYSKMCLLSNAVMKQPEKKTIQHSHDKCKAQLALAMYLMLIEVMQ